MASEHQVTAKKRGQDSLTLATDPVDNTTSWTFDPLGRVATETITVSSNALVRTFRHDAAGNLIRKIDRNGRVIDYSYDSLSRRTTEAWYDNETDADAEQNVRKTYSTTYDAAGRVASAGDGSYDFEYTYSVFGQLTSTTQDLAGLSDDVVFTYAYDALGRKTSVAAKIGTADDYVNTYAYDHLGRVTQITQAGVTGGNAVAEKRVDFAYSDDNTRLTISRFADLAGTKAVAETDQVFDQLGRVADIMHEHATTEFADYDFTWDAAGRLTDFDFTSLVGDDGTGDYSYDDTSQLTGADYDFQTDESYTYDANGNRTITGYTTGDHNRLTSDGTYNYTYDNEGNVTAKTNISTSESVEYTWDHRNRLTKVTFKNSGGVATKVVEYFYDHGQRWVRKTLDTNADGTIEESRVFVHDAGQIVLDFEKTGTGDATNSDLTHRYLWGPAIDQILADDSVDDGTADDVAWALTDHLNTVRDLVEYNPGTDTTSVIKHVTYDAFGNVTSDSATGVESLFLFTARPYDADGGLQNNLNRWYDLSTGRWMSEDPIGFDAGDGNLYRYVQNQPLQAADPAGLLTNIRFQSPRVDGTASVLADWQPGESCLDLYVDGVYQYSSTRTGNEFSGNFDYNWLKRGPASGVANGTIVIRTNVTNHALNYTARLVRWSDTDREVNWAAIENLGLNLSVAEARGDFTSYGGAVHNQAAVWDSTIEVSATWVYNPSAGDGNAVLQNAVSLFGEDMVVGQRVAVGDVHDPGNIGGDPRPSGKSRYTESEIQHSAPLNKWFIRGASWDTWYLRVSLRRTIATEVAARSFLDVLDFELPGVTRPD